MNLSLIIELFPIILTIIEVVKRFIPDKFRDWVNPILAAILGIFGAYIVGGLTEVFSVLLNGLAAGISAVGTYKLPKILADKIGIK